MVLIAPDVSLGKVNRPDIMTSSSAYGEQGKLHRPAGAL
jgi:hypothetical protein